MGFLPKEAVEHHKSTNSMGGGVARLRSVVAPFPPQLKQAMYAAAEKGLIRRRTWDGCAFNAAGTQVGKHVSAVSHAADAFDVPSEVVSRFISTWDGLYGTDERCTGLLKAALLDVGLTEGYTVSERVKKIVRGYAYKSLETQFHEELANVESISDLPGMDLVKADAVQVLLNA